MKLIFTISILLIFQDKSFEQTENFELKLSGLQNQFVNYISSSNCDEYLNKIERLIDEVDYESLKDIKLEIDYNFENISKNTSFFFLDTVMCWLLLITI